jgi:hypothetical protein
MILLIILCIVYAFFICVGIIITFDNEGETSFKDGCMGILAAIFWPITLMYCFIVNVFDR